MYGYVEKQWRDFFLSVVSGVTQGYSVCSLETRRAVR